MDKQDSIAGDCQAVPITRHASFAGRTGMDGTNWISPYTEHIKHSKECELVSLDLTPSRVASFVHGHWPHSQSLLPHTVIASVLNRRYHVMFVVDGTGRVLLLPSG